MRRFILLAAAASVLLSGLIIARPGPMTRELLFADRLAAQEAIERVYYSHQIGATLPFEQAVPRSLMEEKVRTYLEQSAALESTWHTPVTAEMLEAEVQRITSGSQLQVRLREIYGALKGDSLLVYECFARPILVDRLTRSFFAFDRRIHGAELEEAQQLREGLVSGRIPIEAVRDDRIVEKVTRADSEPHLADRAVQPWREDSSREVEAEEYRRWRSQAPARAHEIGPLQEGRFSWGVSVVLEEGTDWARIARYVVPKRDYESWWKTARREFQPANVRAVVADQGPSDPERRGFGRIDTASPAQPETNSPASCQPDDTWSNGGALAAPPFPGYGTAIWTGTQVIFWGGTNPPDDRGGRYDPLTDTWTSTSRAGAPAGRVYHTAVWTGSRMIVWGGNGPGTLKSGGSYDPATDSWTSLGTAGAGVARYLHSAVWTGTRMIIWGGYDAMGGFLADGREYNPSNDHWTSISTTGAPQASTAVWSGTEMIVWGGADAAGARYNPGSNQWTPITTIGAPTDRSQYTAIWTGSRMIVWGGSSSYSGVQLNDGRSYDPSTDAWSAIPSQNAPSARASHTAIWTGNRMIVWGGRYVDHIYNPPKTFYLNTGASYDPTSNSWTPLSTLNAPAPRQEHLAVWAGSRMVVWGGTNLFGVASVSGGRYDPASDTWTPTATTRRPPGARAAWTGTLWILWNGGTEDPGARYDPLTDTWSDISNAGAPPPRTDHTALWTGIRMLVWGGLSDPQAVQGGRYDPLSNSWSPMSTIGAPVGRSYQTAAWTGTHRMLVWGGAYFPGPDWVYTNDGGKYDPVADTWSPIPTAGAPSARFDHGAVWTGTKMVVWGGISSSPGDVSGGIFDPVTDSWSPTSVSGVPTQRRFATAVWTGSRMVVWGGFGESTGYVNSGGLYDPEANAWTSTSSANAPSPRSEHSAVWTGSRMIIFGGQGDSPDREDGFTFNPINNSWAAINLAGGPPPMYRHAAAWTGGSMLVYSGFERGGGQYFLDQAVDNDGDGFSECAGDCNDAIGAVRPGGPQICDGLNNDCSAPGWPAVPASEMDADGDLYIACAECDDTNVNVRPGGTQFCDGLNNDCNSPNWPSLAGTNEADNDLDRVTECSGDCNDANPNVWSAPLEITGFVITGSQPAVLSWDDQSSVGPETISDLTSGLFGPGTGLNLGGGACLQSSVTGAQYEDPRSDPATGLAYWYLVRSRNSCGSGIYGLDSLGQERTPPTCP